MIGALAAIGGLIFTAVATYYSAEISEDQLHQSQDEADRDVRAQAVRVSVWNGSLLEEPVQDVTPTHLHVMNRSPDPIVNVHLRLTVERVVTSYEPTPKFPTLNIILNSIPPCTELTMNQESIRYLLSDEPGAQWLKVKESEFLTFDSLSFQDRDGIYWRRSLGEPTRFVDLEEFSLNARFADPIPERTVKECGDI
ncbi:hypothetical protein AB0G76_13425 [Streptomyces asoensis]|uniref:hypothetical protein n=1 Tax=Streptomyces asoensis TaxID=249586 RepID=UPI0033FC565E